MNMFSKSRFHIHVFAMCILFAVFAIMSGCRVVEVVNHGEEVVRTADGNPVMLADGTAQTVRRGWTVYHNQHWMVTRADTLTAAVKPGEIDFTLNGLGTEPSTNINAIIEQSVSAAVKAAIAIGGK